MESVMTVRLNGDMKERAAAIMRREGYTPSSAVRRLFEYTVKHDGLPFEKSEKPDRDELRRRIEAFDQVHTKRPLTMSDEELREARLRIAMERRQSKPSLPKSCSPVCASRAWTTKKWSGSKESLPFPKTS